MLFYGELAGLAGESERVLRRDGKALVALGITAAERAPATLGIWPARCAICPAGQR